MSEDLSFQEIEEFLESITHNRKLARLEVKEDSKFFMLAYPSSEELFMSRYRRAEALEEAEANGLPSMEDIDELITDYDIISEKDEVEIKTLDEKIVAQKRLLKITAIKARKETIEKQISQFSDRISEIRSQGDNYKYLCREVKADEEAMLYLTWASFHSLDGGKYWDTFKDFENETDLIFRSSAIKLFSELNQGMAVKTVRLIARHGLWRIRYTAATKTGSPLFDLTELTPDQQSLLYWTNYYQSIYEMMPDDQPDEDTIADDDELDAYMERYAKHREKERKQGRIKSGKGKLSAGSKDEVLITTNHPDYAKMTYTEERVSSSEGVSDVEVISPSSKRARNRLGMKRNRR